MTDLDVRRDGRAGRITLDRPGALNALTYDMVRGIDAALRDWAADPGVALVLVEGAGDRAFCAGGDIAEMYATGTRGDLEYGRRFWRDEYRMNARLAAYPKPVVAFLHGFVMGGGVGVGCHASHRVVCETSRIAMPECGIGLVPDVGGSLLLAHAPGRMGEFLGLTATRMHAADAIRCGFADSFVPAGAWADLMAGLAATGDPAAIAAAAADPPEAPLAPMQADIDRHFAGATLADVLASLRAATGDFAAACLARMARNDPLAMAATLLLVRRQRTHRDLQAALDLEYRFTARAMRQGNFIEGIRGTIVERDSAPVWPRGLDDVTPAEAEAMLAPLADGGLNFEDETR